MTRPSAAVGSPAPTIEPLVQALTEAVRGPLHPRIQALLELDVREAAKRLAEVPAEMGRWYD